MKCRASVFAVVALSICFCAGFAGSVDFIVPRAMGPVISRSDLQVQYEYYVDKSGGVQTYVALFDGKTTIRLSPAAAGKIALETAAAIKSGEQSRMFQFDQGTCAYQVANGQRSLVVASNSGNPVTLVNADIDVFVRSCTEAPTLARSWVQGALKLAPAPTAESGSALRPGAGSALRPQTTEAATEPAPASEAAADGATRAWLQGFVPESAMKYVPEVATSAGDRAQAFVGDLYKKDKLTTVLSGILALLCVLLFFLGRRSRKTAYRVHEFGQEQLRELDRRRQEELAAASSQVNDMARQLQRIQRGNDDAVVKLKEEYAENSVIFADMVAELVKSRERTPATTNDLVGELSERYGSTAPGSVLHDAREHSRSLANNNRAANCTHENERFRKAACSFITDVFNLKTDQAAAMINNGMYSEGMALFGEAAKTINAYGRALFQTEVTGEYVQSREDELKALRVARDGGGTDVAED